VDVERRFDKGMASANNISKMILLLKNISLDK
jgi:hypothetical protein